MASEARIQSDAGDVMSLGSSIIRDCDRAKNSGVRSTVPAVDGSTIIPLTMPSLSP